MESLQKKSDTGLDENKQWMSQLPEHLWDIPLYNISIPGSHDSMSYCLDKMSPLEPELPILLSVLDKLVPCLARATILRWAKTQVLNVTQQLNAGVRYLDLRIAHRPDDPSPALYFAHGLFTHITVKEAFLEILAWLLTNPTEVVILSCRRVQDFTLEHHLHLIYCIYSVFGSKLCPKHDMPTLRLMWNMGYQVILSYDDTMAQFYDFLWPSVPYWWADTTSVSTLIHYLEERKQEGRPDAFGTFTQHRVPYAVLSRQRWILCGRTEPDRELLVYCYSSIWIHEKHDNT
ncbi:PI-PLC X domain-containing protein 1 isoform X2 [Xenopus tropicalis]|uniref:PI-PLC X domain-containing protein 1 isoform X2 n=1 Tax=Xenopus tropicalis TaxID=8364 RepID=A0A8J1J786_XENTR|nr:PI-PLC X domain-containing protein 1 isoform X2 [Xenopus tropicalis]